MPKMQPTVFRHDDPADREPLERVALLSRTSPDLPSFHESEFMYMGAVVRSDGVRIHLYKHRDARRYLNLDAQGHAYVYGGLVSESPDDGGFYAAMPSLAAAIVRADLDVFDREPCFFRSTPPAEWPVEAA
jgi:hypothetical protein